MRDRKIWERRREGAPAYEYFQDVFDRWVRIYGPDVLCPSVPRSARSDGFDLMNLHNAEYGVPGVTRRIERVIGHPTTKKKFSQYAFGMDYTPSDCMVFYIKGVRQSVYEKSKCRRMSELFMLHCILGPSFIVADVTQGVGKMMERSAA